MTALLNSVVASPALKYRFPLAVDPPDEPLFDVTMIQKDLMLALDMGRDLEVPMPTSAITNEYLNATRALGFSDQDFAVLYEVMTADGGDGFNCGLGIKNWVLRTAVSRLWATRTGRGATSRW